MKRRLIAGLIIIIGLVAAYFIFFSTKLNYTEELSSEEILEIIKPQIQTYCQELDNKAIYSHCLICASTYSGDLEHLNYLEVKNFSEGQRERYKYIIEDSGKFYTISTQIHKIAGRNDRPAGYSNLIFEIDKKGNLINSNIPEITECLE